MAPAQRKPLHPFDVDRGCNANYIQAWKNKKTIYIVALKEKDSSKELYLDIESLFVGVQPFRLSVFVYSMVPRPRLPDGVSGGFCS